MAAVASFPTMLSTAPQPAPSVAIRQATMAAPPTSSTDETASLSEERDTLAPLAPGLSALSINPEDTESVVQPGRHIAHVAQDIEGELIREKTTYQGGYADVARGIWAKPSGERVTIAIKYLREVSMDSLRGNELAMKQRNDTRMKREAIIWKSADHPNVLPLYGFKSGDEPCLVTPWCEKGNLDDYFRDHPELTYCDKLRLLIQAARGLDYLHTRSPPIAHGDVKPGNVLIKDNDEAAFCDFGLARAMQTRRTLLTTSNQGQGSKGYQSAELIEGDGRPTPQSDVYAFGGLILATLSGKAPFGHIKANAKVMMMILGGKTAQACDHPALPSENPMWTLLASCWAGDANVRPSMADVIEQLQAELDRVDQTVVSAEPDEI